MNGMEALACLALGFILGVVFVAPDSVSWQYLINKNVAIYCPNTGRPALIGNCEE